MNTEEIKELRKKLNLTQLELANHLGVDITTIRNWEQGRNIPKTKEKMIMSFAENYARTKSTTLEESAVQIGVVNGENNNNSGNVNYSSADKETIKTLLELLKEKDKQIAKRDEQISNLIQQSADLIQQSADLIQQGTEKDKQIALALQIFHHSKTNN